MQALHIATVKSNCRRFTTLKLFICKIPTYRPPSCSSYSSYREAWLGYNQRSCNISFGNQNTQRRNSIAPHCKVSHNHQWIQCTFGILVGLNLAGIQIDPYWEHIQMDRGLKLPMNSKTKVIYIYLWLNHLVWEINLFQPLQHKIFKILVLYSKLLF